RVVARVRIGHPADAFDCRQMIAAAVTFDDFSRCRRYPEGSAFSAVCRSRQAAKPDLHKEFQMGCVRFCGFTVLLVWLLCAAIVAQEKPNADLPQGVLPKGADGKALNLDFETGTLQDWTAEGEAFADQPVKGDSVFARREDMKSEHAGEFWVGTYDRRGDPESGSLASAPFTVKHRWEAFLRGGGPTDATRIELVRKANGRVFYKTSGNERENMHRVAVDLNDVMDKEIFIRLVDASSGG